MQIFPSEVHVNGGSEVYLQNTDCQNANDIESHQSVENQLGCSRNRVPRVLYSCQKRHNKPVRAFYVDGLFT